MNGKDDYNVFNAILIITLLTVINFFGVLLFVRNVFNYTIVLPELKRLEIALIFLIIIGANSSLLLINKRYKTIISEFENKSEDKKKIQTIYVVLYVIFSMFFLFFFWR
jgi:hypothetical protein